jgi:hypothetical protein
MSFIRRNLALIATIFATSILAAFTICSLPSFETAAYALGGVLTACSGTAIFIHRMAKNRFDEERKKAMESVENLCISLEFYEKELPFCRYQRFLFGRALDNAHRVNDSLRDWITLVHLHLERQSIKHNGLQLKDVPAFVDNISDQVRQAYKFIQQGSKGEAPKILDIFWFDETEVCGDDVMLFPASRQSRTSKQGAESYLRLSTAYPKLRSVIRSETPAESAEVAASTTLTDDHLSPISSEIASDSSERLIGSEPAVDQVDHPANATLQNATEASPLTAAPANVDNVVCDVAELAARRQSRNDGRNRDVVRSDVLQFDLSKRQKKR